MYRSIILTEERLNKAKTPKGGYCKAQLRVLNIDWTPKQGWQKKLIGTKVTLKRFLAFVRASKNELYLSEIEALLPTLNPPVFDAVQTPLFKPAEPCSKPKKRLSKKERKKEKLSAKKAQREQRIRIYGIHKAIRLIFDKAQSLQLSIKYPDNIFLNSLLRKEEFFIESNDLKQLYDTMHRMKNDGIIRKNDVSLFWKTTRKEQLLLSHSSFTMPRTTREEQLLYIIRVKETNYCKIGISKNPKARLRELQTSNPNKLSIAMLFDAKENANKLEKILHKKFHEKREHGEWFEGLTDDEITKFIGYKAKLIKS